ncbi:DUF349 domain-containing protein [Alkalimonas collagenimarina]|uniref:DUF349 domain-containing protein n=1 Tax=Alkalimonas collagenimarina TaxID=400390 RepID=A0ABT9GW30_9GAMM|nr:DUF349 domain-containing protein [Alkalimonas collagenimarina]MDP4535242.1 DUF349 domain-containing protein [Alkalimonas collagenimarina]
MMIFKRLLRPKWQHPDAEKRVESIAEFEPQQADYKTIMHELAFNDGSEPVRFAALQRLNDFSLWWQAAKHDAADKLRLHAERQVIDMVINNDISTALKQQFIAQCQRSHILEQIALAEQDTSTKLQLVLRLQKPNLIMNALQDSALPIDDKKQLLELIDSDKELEQLSRSQDTVLASMAQAILEQRQFEREQPARIEKQARLLIAKLNALKSRNPADSQQRFHAYQQEWQQLAIELPRLGAESQSLATKYLEVEHSVEQFFSAQWQQQKRAEAQQQKLQQQRTHAKGIAQAIAALRIDVAQHLQQADLHQATALQQHFVAIETQLEQTDVSSDDRQQLQSQLADISQQLIDLPRIALCFTQAEQWLEQWAAQSLPTDMAQYEELAPQWRQWQQQWQQNLKGLSVPLPSSITEHYHKLQQHWEGVLAEFSQQQQRQFKTCRSKLAEFKRLHQAGKFKVLFGLFKGIQSDYQQLSSDERQKLARLYNDAEQQLNELSDWQDYIASPRKQQLVQQMQQLASEPMDNVEQRAKLVKKARADWGTLGQAKDTDDALYQAFDQACEQAFAPCRLHYAAKQLEREQNAQQKQRLVQQMQQLAEQANEQHADAAQLERKLYQLQQQWRSIGPAPKEQQPALQADYQQLNQALKHKVKEQQQTFVKHKQQLIAQAQEAILLEDSSQTASILKQCQQQWKTIPFAGKAKDTLLWQQFRALCDDFFAQRKVQHQQQLQDKEKQQLALESELNQYGQALEQAESAEQLHPLRQQLQSLDLRDFKSLQKTKNQLIADIEQQQENMSQQQKNHSYQLLFQQLASSEPDASAIDVASWREALLQSKTSTLDVMDRHQLTTAIELMAGQNVEAANATELSQVKLQLLTEKHNQSADVTPESLLLRWLQHGPLSDADRALLVRLEAVFIK